MDIRIGKSRINFFYRNERSGVHPKLIPVNVVNHCDIANHSIFGFIMTGLTAPYRPELSIYIMVVVLCDVDEMHKLLFAKNA